MHQGTELNKKEKFTRAPELTSLLPGYDTIGPEASWSSHHVSFAMMLLYPDTKRQQNSFFLVTLVQYFVSAMRNINSCTSLSFRLKFFQIIPTSGSLPCWHQLVSFFVQFVISWLLVYILDILCEALGHLLPSHLVPFCIHVFTCYPTAILRIG